MEVLFIQTGGTIDKDYPKLTGGYAFEITEPAVRRILERADPTFIFEVMALLQKDSQEITDEDREKILEACRDAKQDKIVITHGTDTILDTARELEGVKGKTIVLTGSMRPERFVNSDADFNVGMAVGALSVLNTGVYVAMHGRVIPAENCDRDLEAGQFVVKKWS